MKVVRSTALVLSVLLLAGVVVNAQDAASVWDLVSQGKPDEAVALGRETLAADPEDVRTARILQDVLRADGKEDEARAIAAGFQRPVFRDQLQARLLPPDEAMRRLRKLKESGDASSSLRLDLALAYLALDRARNAESELKGHVKVFPNDAEAHELLGRARFASGNARTARPALEEALRLEPGRPSASVALADVLHALDDAPAARTTLLQAVERYRENLDLLLALANDQIRTGELAAAEVSLTLIAEKRPRDVGALYRLGTVKRAQGKYADVEALAKRILVIDEASAEGNELLAFVYEKQKKWEDALTHYLGAIRAREEWVEPLAGAAFVQLQLGELDYAETMLESALELDEDHASANLSLGILHFLRRQNRQAKKQFEKVLKELPDDPRANRYMGFVLIDETKHKEAITCFEKVLKADPSDAAATRMLGRAQVELGNKLDEAVELLERAVELDGKDPWNRFELGKALEEQEEFEKAQEAYEAAIDLDPTFAWPHLYLAEILDEVERRLKDALDHYSRYLELGGPDPDGEVAGRVKQLTGD